MDAEAQLHVGKAPPQRLSKRIVTRFEFNFKHHHLKNNLKYLAFGFNKNDMHVHVNIWHLVLTRMICMYMYMYMRNETMIKLPLG